MQQREKFGDEAAKCLPGANAPRGALYRMGRLFGIVIMVGSAVVAGFFGYGKWTTGALLRAGRRALARQDGAAALKHSRLAMAWAPNSLECWLLTSDVAERVGDDSRAVAALTRLAEIDRPHAAEYWMRIGAAEMRRGEVRRAEEALDRSLAIDAGAIGALRLRAQLMAVLGRSRDLVDSLMGLVKRRRFTQNDLIVLAAVNPFISDPDRVDSILRAKPHEVLPLLGRIRTMLNQNRTDAAEVHLSRLVSVEPTLWEAQALLGELTLERAGGDFLRWHAALTPAADANSRIWLARGLWLQSRGELEHACRCFWEALEREPECLQATMQLGRTLGLAGQSNLGDQFVQYGKTMQRASSLATRFREQEDWTLASELVTNLERLGRLWEAHAWCTLQMQARPDDPAIAARLAQLELRLTPELPRTLPEARPGRTVDWSQVPLPDWAAYQTHGQLENVESSPANIRFVDEGTLQGLDFEFVNNDPSVRERRIFETTGGGVAALDFDGDGWTDLYFAQAGRWPVVAGSGPSDSLFRNQLGRCFEDVTCTSGIREEGFSQGVAAGDFDNDGFPDVYVANIGRNRLFRNNGDGTFADVTELAGLGGEAWTVSCAIVDLDGDGMPDLFDVNYLQGEQIFTTICVDGRGEPHVCRPTVFESAVDRIWLNRGDGRFAGMSSEAGLNLPDGRGLGLIVADFNSDGRLDVFVGNDQSPNYLLLNEPAVHSNPLRFSEQAHIWGVALDRDGLPRASMGIASGDANRDGRLDLFVTNFSQESDVLYLSQVDGSLRDATREVGLRAATFELLGFGTQFLDADLDGVLDLIILNGHIDNFGSSGKAYRMRSQFFRGLAGPRFVELTGDQAGAFFHERRLGRGLATLDWNRDGLPDFVATFLDGPVALGTNKTQCPGNFLRLKLVGTTASRDAIGAQLRIVVTSGDERRIQLTAGDGYESSNERLVHVGLGVCDHIERLEIVWPSGTTSVFEDVAGRTTWLAIEGTVRLTELIRAPP